MSFKSLFWVFVKASLCERAEIHQLQQTCQGSGLHKKRCIASSQSQKCSEPHRFVACKKSKRIYDRNFQSYEIDVSENKASSESAAHSNKDHTLKNPLFLMKFYMQVRSWPILSVDLWFMKHCSEMCFHKCDAQKQT